MKVTFKLDSGTEICTGPENIIINGATDKPVVSVGYKLDGVNSVPVLFFGGYYFNPEEMVKHDKAVVETALAAAAKNQTPPATPAAPAVPPAPPAVPDPTVTGQGS